MHVNHVSRCVVFIRNSWILISRFHNDSMAGSSFDWADICKRLRRVFGVSRRGNGLNYSKWWQEWWITSTISENNMSMIVHCTVGKQSTGKLDSFPPSKILIFCQIYLTCIFKYLYNVTCWFILSQHTATKWMNRIVTIYSNRFI